MVPLSYGNRNFRQETPQKLLKVSIFCAWSYFLQPVNCIIHHALLEFSTLWICWKWEGKCAWKMTGTYIVLLGCHCLVYYIILKLHSAAIVNSFSLVKKCSFMIWELEKLAAANLKKIYCWKWRFWIVHASAVIFLRCDGQFHTQLCQISSDTKNY